MKTQSSPRGVATSVTLFFLLALLTSVLGCAAPKEKTNYAQYLAHMPRSVVIIPPLNQSAQVRAPEAFLSTITVPLAERGYYVFPVALVHGMMRENGLPTTGEMNQVSPQKIHDIFGADAALYINIKEWTNRYMVIDSTTSVHLEYRLVDTATGEELWHRDQLVQNSSNQNNTGGDPMGMLVGAAIGAAIHAGSDVNAHRERQLAVQANTMVIGNTEHGMLLGARHKDFDKDQQKHREDADKSVAKASNNP
jgi:hypothetical protein